MRIVHAVLVVATSACWRNADDPPVMAKHGPAGLFTINQAGFGPIDAKTPATLIALRQRLTGYDVRPSNDGGSLSYDVYAGGERLFYVVPDDDGTVFNVHATSPKIAVADRSWRAGTQLAEAPVGLSCECWGVDDDYTACYVKHEHIAVVFHFACQDQLGDNDSARDALVGVPVERVVWAVKPFGEDADDGNLGVGGESYGGESYGGSATDPWEE